MLLGAVAFAVRAYALGFAETMPRARPDEELFVVAGLGLFSHDKNPHYGRLGWPELFFFMVHGAQRVYSWFLQLWYGYDVNLGCVYALSPMRLTILGRMISCISGTLTVLLSVVLARRVVPIRMGPDAKRVAGLWAGWFLALNYLHVRDSHFGVSDATLLLFLTAMLVSLTRVMDGGRWQDFVWAGVFAGLAVSTKWTALSFLPLCVLAVMFRFWIVTRRRLNVLGLAILSATVLLLVFVCTSPHVLVEPRDFYEGILSHKHRFEEGSVRGYNYDPLYKVVYGLAYHFRVTFPLALGWPLFSVTLLGLAYSIIRRSASLFLVGCSVLSFYCGVLAPSTAVFLRYSLPIHPALCVLGGVVVGAVYGWMRSRVTTLVAVSCMTALSIALLSSPTLRVFRLLEVMKRLDTRDLASQWLVQHMLPNERMITRGAYSQIHSLEEEGVQVCTSLLPPDLHMKVPVHVAIGSPYKEYAKKGREGWGNIGHDAIFRYVQGVPLLEADWVAQGTPLLACGRKGRSDGVETPPSCFRTVKTISPGKPECDTLYDSFDSFFAPVDRFHGVTRLGPLMEIQKNECKFNRPAR